MAYLDRTDILYKIRDRRLDQLLDNDTSLLDTAVETAVAVVIDHLNSRYDTDTIFAKTGTDRDKQVIRWVANLALYYLYERVPNSLIPEDIKFHYDETMQLLADIEDGKRAVLLERKQDSEGKSPTKFRWGSEQKRSH